MKKTTIKLCKHTPDHALLATEITEAIKGISVKRSKCIKRCSICKKKPVALVGTTSISANSTKELIKKIKQELAPLEAKTKNTSLKAVPKGLDTSSLTTTVNQDGVTTIMLSNSTTRNSLSEELLKKLYAALELCKEQQVRAIILRTETVKGVWSSGLDIRELPVAGRDPLAYNDPLEQVLREIQHFPAPVIAMVDGSVWGGACDLVLSCDLTIGTAAASFAITPAHIGIPYNSAGIMHVVNVIGLRLAKELFFTAKPITAKRALQVGILYQLVPKNMLEEITYGVAHTIASNAPLAIRAMKEQLRLLGDACPLSPETFEKIQGLRRTVYDSHDYAEGKQAFLEKRKPVFSGT